MLPKITRNEYTSIARIWRDDASYRYTQQHRGWSLEDCQFLDYLKKIPITYSVTQGERLRHKNPFVLKWKNPKNPGNVSIHEKIPDAVKQRATMAYRWQGYTCITPQEKTRQRSIDLQLRSRRIPAMESSVEHRRRRHRHRQRHGGIRNNRKILNSGEDGSKKNGKISSGGRRGKYSRSEPSPLLQESCTFYLFEKVFAFRHQRMSCTRRGGKTEHLTGRSTHAYFSRCAPCSTVVSHFTFHSMHVHWLKA